MDRRLVHAARQGDRTAFAELAREISDRLFGVASRILQDTDAAGDVLQVSLIQIWRDLPRLRDDDRFEAWAHRIVIRRSRTHLRSLRSRPRPLRILPNDAIAIEGSEAAIGVREELEHAFSRLSADHRTVVVLAYVNERSVVEIAAMLGISVGTVKSRLHYARQALRSAIEAEARLTPQEGRTA